MAVGSNSQSVFAGATQAPHVVHFKIDRIRYSTLDVGRSMLDVHQFLLRSDWMLAARRRSCVTSWPKRLYDREGDFRFAAGA